MPNWAWSGYIRPLDLPEEKIAGFLPGAVGKWNGKLYSVGFWDAAVAIFARKSVLQEHNIRVPSLDEPWTGDEFTAALKTLKASGKFAYPIDLGMADKTEWYPYAFSPFLQSFGGDLVNRDTYLSADDVLNGENAIKFGEWWQSLFKDGLAPGTSQSPSDHETGFVDGKYALQWMGNWVALPALEKFKDDLVFLPAPDFGNGSKIGAASWQFGVSSKSPHPEGAAAFIEFAIQDKYLAQFSDGIGLIRNGSRCSHDEELQAGWSACDILQAVRKAGDVAPRHTRLRLHLADVPPGACRYRRRSRRRPMPSMAT